MPPEPAFRCVPTQRGEVLSRKATQHHDFVGQAEPAREQSARVRFHTASGRAGAVAAGGRGA